MKLSIKQFNIGKKIIVLLMLLFIYEQIENGSEN